MEILRTPEARFASLPGFHYAARYAEVRADGGPALRMAYVDEGDRAARPVLALHGEPTWGYLYRRVVAPLRIIGLRVVVPDFIGFGRSDKPAAREDYTYARHVQWVTDLVHQLDLRDVILLGQDWGGLIGLRLVAAEPERFAAVVASNTFLPTGDQDLGDSFHTWRRFSQEADELPIGAIVSAGTVRTLSPAEIAAYEAPFPDERHKAGARQFPMLVPATPDDPEAPANRAAWEVLSRWDRPFLTAFGDSDPVTAGADVALQQMIPGAAGQPHVTLERTGHFSPEDAGARLAGVIVELNGHLP
ncbi:MAG TPA: haloalkane dehalogenase [Capillimicrobium sp.]|nr:haloalkane dehalogenase [Capillimicrobium sp.]